MTDTVGSPTRLPRDLRPLAAPRADRPRMPSGYGMPPTTEGLRDWAEVEARLAAATVYWIVTAGPSGQPRARPVDGLYVDGRLFVGGDSETRWVRDLEANPMVTIHLEDGWDVVIVEGVAEPLPGVVPALAERLAAASQAKYPQYGATAADYTGPGPFAIHPRLVLAWKSFPADLTRYRFADDGR